MNARLMWFLAGVAATGAVMSVIGLFGSQPYIVRDGEVSEDFGNAFAMDAPLVSDWTRVHQLGALDIWSDDSNSALAITENGRAIQLLTSDGGCCVFDIYEYGEYRATIKYGDDKPRLIMQGRDPTGTVWTYVDKGIDGTIDLRLLEDVSNSAQQVTKTVYESKTNLSNDSTE